MNCPQIDRLFDRRISPYGAFDMAALEKRIKVFVLEGGGFAPGAAPQCDPVNFAPRPTAPTLLLNGRYDMGFQVETSAKSLMQLQGTPEHDKKLVLLDGGHIPPLNADIRRELLLWLDRYLGPVR